MLHSRFSKITILSSYLIVGVFLSFDQQEKAVDNFPIIKNPKKEELKINLNFFNKIFPEKKEARSINNIQAKNYLLPTGSRIREKEKKNIVFESPARFSLGEEKIEEIKKQDSAPVHFIGKPEVILTEVKNANGRKICVEIDKDHPKKSNKNEKWHIDAECCLDPDEIPNSNCYYPPEKYGEMIQRYLEKFKNGKIK